MERKLTLKQPVHCIQLLGLYIHQKFLTGHSSWWWHLCSQLSTLCHRVMFHIRIWEHGDFCPTADPSLAKPAAHIPCWNQWLLRAHTTFALCKEKEKLAVFEDTTLLMTGDKRTPCNYGYCFFEIGRVMHSHLNKHMEDISSAHCPGPLHRNKLTQKTEMYFHKQF